MLMEALWSLYFRAVFLNDDIPFRSGHKHKDRKIFRGNPWSYRWAEILGVLGRQIEVLCHDWFIVKGLTSVKKGSSGVNIRRAFIPNYYALVGELWFINAKPKCVIRRNIASLVKPG
ncbi:hypothetical protein Glove_110g26 [Diversispora epigaea]|uniref:Uncharacterized protein n=1 Tax=Diversispora epigaea TaxID=1348612 RepID=A0A397JBC7_9GLOM|nr:hypothetical protein Glove_110g26 [Diversispora epigaea]